MARGRGWGCVARTPRSQAARGRRDRKMLKQKQTQTKEHSTYSLHILEHIKMRNCVAFDEAATAYSLRESFGENNVNQSKGFV